MDVLVSRETKMTPPPPLSLQPERTLAARAAQARTDVRMDWFMREDPF
jgi:hypothetical protein